MDLRNLTEEQIKQMLNMAHDEINSIKKVQFSPLEPVEIAETPEDIDFLKEIELEIRVELGSTYLTIKEILELREDAVISLDKMAGDPVDIYIKDSWIAQGEILVINDVFGIRISAINKAEGLPLKGVK